MVTNRLNDLRPTQYDQLEPETQAYVDKWLNEVAYSGEHLSVSASRKFADAAFAEVTGPEVHRVTEYEIEGPDGDDLKLRVYTPEGEGPFPLLVYFHGGGFVFCSLETTDALCRELSNRIGCVVVSVDYRQAPENPFPAGIEDCYRAVEWVSQFPEAINGLSDRIAVGGDSVGGTLATVVCLMARDRGGPQLVHQLMVYPPLDLPGKTQSYEKYAKGYWLTSDVMEWFFNHYFAREADKANPYAVPLHARSLEGLPPALMITAEFDPLRDECFEYVDRLRAAKVETDHVHYDDTIHPFFLAYQEITGRGDEALKKVAATLRQAFGLETDPAQPHHLVEARSS